MPSLKHWKPATVTSIPPVFITTKLWNNSHPPDDVMPALHASLKDLGTDYLDLYLMHSPSPFARGEALIPKSDDKIQVGDTDYVDAWKAMDKALENQERRKQSVFLTVSRAELDRLLQ